jgi:ribosomal protein S18 acetylase RimI-like enzyme
MLIRTVSPDEKELCAVLGEFVRVAYRMLPGHVEEPDYEDELADVAARAAMPETEVIAAFDDDGQPLGSVTYAAGDGSPMTEHTEPNAASFRMLGVDPAAQRNGAGRALVEACIARAVAAGRTAVVLHSTEWMTGAHRLYGRLGFVRHPAMDWEPVPGIKLLGFRRDLTSR